jgi:chemotaxis protein MotB
MRSVKLSTVVIALVVSGGLALLSGCEGQLTDAQRQNQVQQQRISELESQLQAGQLQLDQLKRQLSDCEKTGGVEVDTLRQKIAALEEDLTKKEQLIKSMQDRLLGVAPLPVELNTALEDLTKKYDMVEFDPNRGLVKFKSDLLFDKGSDAVTPAASEALKALCGILNSEQAKDFHIVIAGHTDDIPIRRPQTQVAHPSNWHLSCDRAISVLNVLESCGVVPQRMSVRGYGEYHPVAPNAPNKGGNPKNRRVEIYIVPAGV